MADLARSILDRWGWAILAALVSVAIAWGTFSHRVATLERDLHALETEWRSSSATAQKTASDVSIQLTRLTEQIVAMREQIARIEARDRRTDASHAGER